MSLNMEDVRVAKKSPLAERLQEVKDRIAAACAKARREPAEVTLIAVTKYAAPEQIREIEQAFAALPSKIPAIADFEWGTNNSPEGLDQGFTHCFLVTFHDEKGRDKYLPHPAHQEFVQKLRPILDQAFVIDYWTKS